MRDNSDSSVCEGSSNNFSTGTRFVGKYSTFLHSLNFIYTFVAFTITTISKSPLTFKLISKILLLFLHLYSFFLQASHFYIASISHSNRNHASPLQSRFNATEFYTNETKLSTGASNCARLTIQHSSEKRCLQKKKANDYF